MGAAQREWQLRAVPDDLVEQYRASGAWRGESLGSMVADGLGSMGHAPFAVHSQVRPWSGTFADVDRAAHVVAGNSSTMRRFLTDNCPSAVADLRELID